MKTTKVILKTLDIIAKTDYTYNTFDFSSTKTIKKLKPSLDRLLAEGYIIMKDGNLHFSADFYNTELYNTWYNS